MFSPGLEQFINSHPRTLDLLRNTLTEAFSNKTVVLYYFYTDDKSKPRAFHYYANDVSVVIMLEENDTPIDQFISFIFEVVNSESEKNFKHICLQAGAGELSKEQFATAMLSQEFIAVKRTRELIKKIEPSGDVANSQSYKQFIDCPDKFQDFLEYTKKLDPQGSGVFDAYYAEYDSLRHSNPDKPNLNTTN